VWHGNVLTVVVNHDFYITEDLAVPPMGLVPGLGGAVDALSLKDTLGLGIENERDGQQPFDPF
jgi:hypothetical protein